MRNQLRPILLCALAALLASCTNDAPTQDAGTIISGPNMKVASPACCPVDIGDRVWFDVNCNGIQDKDETGGPEGVKVTLTNCDTDEEYVTYTDSDGNYLFNVPAGTYITCFDIPEGYAATLEDEGSNDGIDSDINSQGCTACREYECDKPDLSRDAGLCEKKGEEGGEGCTPGFWRNHLAQWTATPYSPDDKVNATFGCDLVSDDNLTLGTVIDAPQTYGVLAFHAIAALLNSTHPGVEFGLDAGEVIDLACAGDKDTLAAENEEGCPLSGGNTTGQGRAKTK
jgi:hypothetical protein